MRITCLTDQPILDTQSFDTLKLTKIPGHDDQSVTASVPGDEEIIAAYDLALPFKYRTDIGCVARSIRIKGQYFQPRRKTLHLTAVMLRLSRLGSAGQQEIGKGTGKE